MVLYEVFDGNEFEVAFPTKRAAVQAAREVPRAVVTRVRIRSPISRETACALINGEGYALEQTKIYENERDE